MDRREALEMARSLAPEASAAEHVEYATFLVGSGAVEAPEAVDEVSVVAGGEYPVGTIALSDTGVTVLPWVREEDGWHLYSTSSGYRYLPNRTTEDIAMYDTVVVGMVRPVRDVNPFVGQSVLESDEALYTKGAVALDKDGDVWYHEGNGVWSFFAGGRGRETRLKYQTRDVVFWRAVIVA